MPKLAKVTDAEVIACFKGAEDFLAEMHDLMHRFEHGSDRMDHPEHYAKEFALIARAANSMVCHLLMRAELQTQQAELDALRNS
jgi:hypothetical protein